MNLKKQLNCIQGWLPKDANKPTLQQVTNQKFFPTHKATAAFVVLLASTVPAGWLLSKLGNVLGISSALGVFWDLITSMVITFAFLFIYGRIQRKEAEKEAKLREL
jgi:hypothetical protein